MQAGGFYFITAAAKPSSVSRRVVLWTSARTAFSSSSICECIYAPASARCRSAVVPFRCLLRSRRRRRTGCVWLTGSYTELKQVGSSEKTASTLRGVVQALERSGQCLKLVLRY
jgi:hypothetical protein